VHAEHRRHENDDRRESLFQHDTLTFSPQLVRGA
jgi:hypothetical protein